MDYVQQLLLNHHFDPELEYLIESEDIGFEHPLFNLLNLNSIVFQYDQKKSSDRLIVLVVRTEDRIGAKQQVQQILTANRIDYQDGVITSRSIEGLRSTDIKDWDGKNIRIFYKPKQSGGSGAGGEITALAESFQCYACAARQVLGQPLQTAEEVYTAYQDNNSGRYVDADRTIEETRTLSPRWMQSGVIIANAFAEQYGKRKYVFHRQSSLVTSIEKEFYRLAKKEGIRLNINKWNPADIWAVDAVSRNDLQSESLSEYNQWILDLYNQRKMIGVSLKLVVGSAKWEIFNHNKSKKAGIKFDSYRTHNTKFDFFDSKATKSVFIYFKLGSTKTALEFRSFSGGPVGWQGEIQGKHAASGKIGQSALDNVLISNGITTFLTSKDVQKEVKKRNDKFYERYVRFYQFTNGTDKRKPDQLIKLAKQQHQEKGDGWFYSKWLGMQYLYLILFGRRYGGRKIDPILSAIIRYASSSTSSSSVHIKYS